MLIVDSSKFARLLVERKLDAAHLARACDVSPGTVAALARRDAAARYSVLGRIADALGIDYTQILKEDPQNE